MSNTVHVKIDFIRIDCFQPSALLNANLDRRESNTSRLDVTRKMLKLFFNEGRVKNSAECLEILVCFGVNVMQETPPFSRLIIMILVQILHVLPSFF